jgi:hypothetical protein
MTHIALFTSIIISVGSLVYGYANAGLDPFARWLLIFGVVWLISQLQRWEWFSAAALIVIVLIAGLGLWIGASPGWMFSSGIFALLAWDLSEFRGWMRFTFAKDEHPDLERRHIARLSLLALSGLALSSVLIRLRFNVEWAILLVVVLLLGLTQWMGWLRTRQ